jgi:cysteinyl-tRNA synthetase
MSLHVYNTLSRKKEPFETLVPDKVSMYVCGPTVYDKAHVGHAMFILIFDSIRRYLEFLGYKVHQVMNYTDVDDKIIKRAQAEGEDPIELAERYIDEFKDHLLALNVLPPAVTPRATAVIEQIISMVQSLVEKGCAYPVKGDVYFRVNRDEDYGKLSGRKLEDMQAGARVEVDERKDHPMDFALWKASKPGEPSWKSPWGDGRPGWHIECSAMNLQYLGEQIDIHGGGNDLIFPHHENEIAQTESLTGKPMARYWMHNGMMQLSGEKMSKSLGNLVTIEEFLADYSADTLRMMVLNSGYRRPLTYSEATLNQANRALARIQRSLEPIEQDGAGSATVHDEALEQQIVATRQGFCDSMDDDFNTAGALGYIFELVRGINQGRAADVSGDLIRSAQNVLRELTSVLGLRLDENISRDTPADPYIDLLVKIRSDLRQHKLWEMADVIRDSLDQLGVTLEDGKEGTTWRWEL